jgi:DNA-binding IclR family transcriptional regulator
MDMVSVKWTNSMEVRSVDRAVDILQTLAEARGPLSVLDLQKSTGLSRPTLYRILQTLQKRDLILAVGEPLRFSLHYGVFRLGAAWSQSVDISAFGRPILEQLRETLGETAALFVPILPDRRICVLESVSNQTLTFSLGVGDIQSLAVGAAGKVMLAAMSEDLVAGALASLKDGVRKQIEKQLELARAEGGLVLSGEVMAEGFGIGAAVFAADGQVCGSLAVLGPHARLKPGASGKYLEEVKLAAAKLSTLLGHKPLAAGCKKQGVRA